ncbi:mRNA-associated protein mrnp, putative [Pediculus humanus corporis]|uniref:mRNA-associated protein mrnp, putative n=1 Tax=Pediculus humanus subsp. corporis TaxID=121224 RepID=E0VWN2_PEDHC|nr:mRNA-associated protein mrnp, putative [Pediculus humanus corporis]EEB17788.1 mRNA-associated protein mrnp, putative [Pediculus humanus corporis]
MFNQSGLGGTTFGLPGATVSQTTHNPMKDFEVTSPPDDSVSSIAFSPASLPQNFLIAGSWDNNVRCWEVEQSGKTIPKSIQSMDGPILDVCWSDDGTKVFMASCDKQVKAWDLASNQTIQVAAHDAPVKTCHWVQGGVYSCLMTGSWDKTLKFWDTRTPNPIMTINLPERVYCVDVDYPMAVVGTAGRSIIVYQLEGKPQEFKRMESPLKYQHRCIAIFRNKKKIPTGFAIGSVEGRVAIQYVTPASPKENFSFKCHRVANNTVNGYHDIYAVNDLAFHPVHGTLATVGSDGTISFWDKDARTKLKPFEPLDQPIVACAFNHNGHIFAYAASYDWSKGHEYYNPAKKSAIFLRSCFEDMKGRASS